MTILTNTSLRSDKILVLLGKLISITSQVGLTYYLFRVLGEEGFAIWSVLTSAIVWLGLSDMGVTNGLRNSLTRSIYEADWYKVSALLYGGYVLVASWSIILCFMVVGAVNIFDIQAVFGIESSIQEQIENSFIVLATGFLFKQVFKVYSSYLSASGRVGLASIIEGFPNLIILFIITVLVREVSLVSMSLIFAVTGCLVPLVASLTGFALNSPKLLKVSKYDIGIGVRNIAKPGILFFLIQVLSIFFFQSLLIFISRAEGDEFVNQYVFMQRYSAIGILVPTALASPYWPRINNAFIKGEKSTLLKYWKSLNRISIIFAVIMVIASFFAFDIVHLWSSGEVNLNRTLIFQVALISVFTLRLNIVTTILNGLNKIRIQVKILSIVSIIYLTVLLVLCAVTTGTGILNLYGSMLAVLMVGLELTLRKYIKGDIHKKKNHKTLLHS